ncbi:uncharacterized protein [Apostichopus japonicus]|uniref:uncharacterized protein n=1 Tax=Stichopus japonicus TaxID=307972 RepID=UPI003AB64565
MLAASKLRYLTLAVVCLTLLPVTIATECESLCNYAPGDDEADCFGRGLTAIPSGCEDALDLQAAGNHIAGIDQDTFRGFHRLEYLYIGNSRVARLGAQAFQPVASTLQILDLSINRLTELESNTFMSMLELRKLDLQKNQIARIASHAFEDLPVLTVIFLSDNALSDLSPSSFRGLPRLNKLFLKNNRLLQLDSRLLLSLYHLTTVVLTNNSIAALTGGVHTSASPRIVDLSYNNIASFDCDWISHMANLTLFNLSHNVVETIVGCQSRLQILSLDHNRFDCGCQTHELAQVYKKNPLLTAPTCYTPLVNRNTGLDQVNFSHCYLTGPENSTPTPSPRESTPTSPTDQIISSVSTKFWDDRPADKRTTSEQTVLDRANSGLAANNQAQLFDSKEILYGLIAAICILLLIVIFLTLVFVRCRKRKQSPPIPTSGRHSQLSSRPPSSHHYQEIPGSGQTMDGNSNILPHPRLCSCGHQQDFTGQPLAPFPRHRSDSQDSGLADHTRNSVSDWILNNVQYIPVTEDTSFTHCDIVEMNMIHPHPPYHSEHQQLAHEMDIPHHAQSVHRQPPHHPQSPHLPQSPPPHHPQSPHHTQSLHHSQPSQHLQSPQPSHPQHQLQPPLHHLPPPHHNSQLPDHHPSSTTHPHSTHHFAQEASPQRTYVSRTSEKRAALRRCSSCSCHRNRPRECKNPVIPQSETLLHSSGQRVVDAPCTSGYVSHQLIS